MALEARSESLMIIIPLGVLLFLAMIVFGGPGALLGLLDQFGREIAGTVLGFVRGLL